MACDTDRRTKMRCNDQTKQPKRLMSQLACATVLSMLLVACNSSDDSTTTDSSTSTTTETTSTDCAAVVKQGALLTCLANQFLATLSSTEQAAVLYGLDTTNASQYWSNLPVSLVPRHGIALENLSTTSKAAAETLLNAALASQGQTTMAELRTADGYLGILQSGYGKDLYYISFLGTPSATSPWVLQFTGHHYTFHASVSGDSQVSMTPNFVAVEPTKWTDNGVTHEPLATRRDAFLAMLNGLSSAELTTAKLPQAYDDVLVGPQKDATFPTTSEGLAVSGLTTAQKTLVKAAINRYAADGQTDQSAVYTSDAALSKTYISWASYADLSTKGSYVRIDGPRVWIEFSVQSGIVIRDQNHYHSIWRDKEKDYGGTLTFSPSTASTVPTGMTGTPPTLPTGMIGTPPTDMTGTPPALPTDTTTTSTTTETTTSTATS
jgi:hypothetical protein